MSDVPGAVREGLQDEITCPICQEFFQDPKILPCGHYYCKQCILQLARELEQSFPCPECRKDTFLPPTGADELPTAFFVNRMKSLYKRVPSSSSCREGLHHRRMKDRTVTVVNVEELDSSSGAIGLDPMKCKKHQEQLKLFCFTCDQLVCRECVVTDHSMDVHDFEFKSKCAPQIKEALQEKFGPLKITQGQIQDARKQLKQSGIEIAAQGTHLERVINSSFDEMIEVLERRRRELLTTVRGRVEEKLLSLSSQEKFLELSIQSLVNFVGQNIENASDEEIVCIHKQLQYEIEEELRNSNTLDLTPAASANISVDVSCAEEIAELSQKISVTTIPDPFQYTAEGPGMKGAVTNTPTELVVHAVCSSSMDSYACKEEQSIKAELKSMVDGSVAVAEVTEKEKGSYLVSYCPKVRGHNKLILLVNKYPIPFNVFVEHPPTQLGKPVRIIKGVEKPYSITLNKSGHLLVTQPEKGAVTALSKDGRVVPGGKGGLESPSGIAVDENGSLLVTLEDSQKLVRFNQDWTLAKAIGERGDQPGQFNGIGRVKISLTHEYYVCDWGNHRIQVFDQDLKHISSFGRCGNKPGQFNHPCNLAFDDAGHVYVVDSDNHRIQKFSPRGEPIIAFGSGTGSGESRLCYPRGIHIIRQFIYVTDLTRLVVFTTDGEFVTSLGCEQELHQPRDITADENGLLYVCSYNKDQIVVY